MKVEIKISLEVEGKEAWERVKSFTILPGMIPEDMDSVLDGAMRSIAEPYMKHKIGV